MDEMATLNCIIRKLVSCNREKLKHSNPCRIISKIKAPYRTAEKKSIYCGRLSLDDLFFLVFPLFYTFFLEFKGFCHPWTADNKFHRRRFYHFNLGSLEHKIRTYSRMK